MDGSSGWLLVGGRDPRVPGRSKVWVATTAPDVVNCSESKCRLMLVDSLGMVNFLQKGPGILQFLGSILVGGRAKVKRLTGWSIGSNLVAGSFGTFWLGLESMFYARCMDRVQ